MEGGGLEAVKVSDGRELRGVEHGRGDLDLAGVFGLIGQKEKWSESEMQSVGMDDGKERELQKKRPFVQES